MDECKNSEKTDWITKAKGFGILGVVAVHTIQRFTISSHSLTDTARAGMYCVQLFFIISAYLTFISLDKNKRPLTTINYLRYIGHKLVRLVPILYTAVIWHVLMNYPLLFGEAIEHQSHIWRNAFYAVTFTNGFTYHYINPWVNWYIGDVVIFWAVAPFLFRWINSVKRSVWFFVVSITFSWLISFTYGGFDEYTIWFLYFWFPSQLPVLAIGIMFYHFQKSSYVASKHSFLTLAFVVSSCLLMSFFLWVPTPMEIHVRFGLFLFVFAYTLFYYSGKWFNWLKVLGNNSYGVYLYHWCLIPIFDYIVRKYGVSQTSIVNFVCYYVLLILISLLFAKFANILFEKPFFRLMKRKFGI